MNETFWIGVILIFIGFCFAITIKEGYYLLTIPFGIIIIGSSILPNNYLRKRRLNKNKYYRLPGMRLK